jgi:hypothetical protein
MAILDGWQCWYNGYSSWLWLLTRYAVTLPMLAGKLCWLTELLCRLDLLDGYAVYACFLCSPRWQSISAMLGAYSVYAAWLS